VQVNGLVIQAVDGVAARRDKFSWNEVNPVGFRIGIAGEVVCAVPPDRAWASLKPGIGDEVPDAVAPGIFDDQRYVARRSESESDGDRRIGSWARCGWKNCSFEAGRLQWREGHQFSQPDAVSIFGFAGQMRVM